MAVTLISTGAFTTGTSASLTPVAGSFAAGDALFAFTGEGIGSQTITTPAGWTVLDQNTNALQTRCFGKIAAGGDTMPTFTWGTGSQAWAIIFAFRGVDSSFTPATTPLDRAANVTTNIVGPAASRTPSVAGSLVFLFGQRNKTATSNGTVYTAPAGFTMGAQQAPNGNSQSVAICYWIQTTATLIAANTSITGSVAESVAQSMQGSMILLQPAVGGGATRASFGLLGVGS